MTQVNRTMFRKLLSLSLAVLWAGALSANAASVKSEPHHLVIQVNGIVCSFCAYGTEKNLARLPFLDDSKFGDGVLVNIDTHQVTLALRSDAPIQYADIADAIRRGGYDPVTYYPVIRGRLDERAGRLVLTDLGSGQVYRLPPDLAAPDLVGGLVWCEAELEPETAAGFEPGAAVELSAAVLRAAE